MTTIEEKLRYMWTAGTSKFFLFQQFNLSSKDTMAALFKIARVFHFIRKIEIVADFILKKNKLDTTFSINELTGSV